jgi:hypothetical protein
MSKYVIERELPGAGKLSPAQLKEVSQRSCAVRSDLGPQIRWHLMSAEQFAKA